MLARSFRRNTSLFLRQAQTVRTFSTQETNVTSEDLAAGRAEWGVKYDDECLQFEKEWKTIADRVTQEQQIYIDKELGDLQKKKVEMIVDKVLDFNVFEMRYFSAAISQRML